MGRAGRGGGSSGGSRSSGSRHSFSSSSRSSSSHSFSSSRASSGRSSGGSSSGGMHFGTSGRVSGGYGGYKPTPPSNPRPSSPPVSRSTGPVYTRAVPPPPPPRPPRGPVVHNTVYVDRRPYSSVEPYRENAGSGVRALTVACAICLILGIIFCIAAMSRPADGVTASTTNREKLELGYGYSNDTLLDELGWIKDPGRLNRNLKDFYQETGVTPYIALVMRPEITAQGPDAEEAYTDTWYSDNLPHEGYLLLMYFDPGTGEDGNCYLRCGEQVGVLFDSEAQNIFWEYLDSYWFSDSDEDTLFAQTFNKTAGRIMQRQTTSEDVVKSLLTVSAVGCAVAGVICIMLLRRKHEAERAAETERILSQPLQKAQSPEEDELLKQYSDDE